jgi:hypothetical protein
LLAQRHKENEERLRVARPSPALNSGRPTKRTDLESNIPGTGEFRKLRWEDARRGGLRIIFYLLTADHQVWFFTLYDKDEAADLSQDEKHALKQAIQAELAQRRPKR